MTIKTPTLSVRLADPYALASCMADSLSSSNIPRMVWQVASRVWRGTIASISRMMPILILVTARPLRVQYCTRTCIYTHHTEYSTHALAMAPWERMVMYSSVATPASCCDPSHRPRPRPRPQYSPNPSDGSRGASASASASASSSSSGSSGNSRPTTT